MESHDWKLRRLVKKGNNRYKWMTLFFFVGIWIVASFGFVNVYASFINTSDANISDTVTTVAVTTIQTTQATTQPTTQETSESTTTNTRKTTSTVTTEPVTTTSVITTTVTTTSVEMSKEKIATEEKTVELTESYDDENVLVYFEEVYDESPESVEEVVETLPDAEAGDRTRPYISSGEYTLASMMANEAGSSDITAIRTGIGFMNRIHNSQFQNGSIEGVKNAGGYCYSTPNAHHQELAEEVIAAYNESDQYWAQYCEDHQTSDKTVFHHNGTKPQPWEYPKYIEYGDTGGYQWTMLYSEHINDHY